MGDVGWYLWVVVYGLDVGGVVLLVVDDDVFMVV